MWIILSISLVLILMSITTFFTNRGHSAIPYLLTAITVSNFLLGINAILAGYHPVVAASLLAAAIIMTGLVSKYVLLLPLGVLALLAYYWLAISVGPVALYFASLVLLIVFFWIVVNSMTWWGP